MRNRTSILLLFVLAVLLVSCRSAAQKQVKPSLTPWPVAQATDVLAISSGSDIPAETAVQHPVPSPTWLPVASVTPISPSASPQSLQVLDTIQIRLPGAGSTVISPISVQAQFTSEETVNSIRIELHGEDGKLLVRKVIDPARLYPLDAPFTDLIEFEIAAQSLDGWLIVGLDDAPDYPLAVNSLPLVLLSSGIARINPATWQAKSIDIQQPGPSAESSDGIISVAGLTSLEIDQLLKVQLLAPGGKVIGQSLAEIGGKSTDQFKPFTAQLAYNVEERTAARLIVFSELGETGVILHLASLPVFVSP
jgi:hypothetical protein